MDMQVSIGQRVNIIGNQLAENGAVADATDTFSAANVELLRSHGVYAALVPAEFGGGGCDYAEVCGILRQIAERQVTRGNQV